MSKCLDTTEAYTVISVLDFELNQDNVKSMAHLLLIIEWIFIGTLRYPKFLSTTCIF